MLLVIGSGAQADDICRAASEDDHIDIFPLTSAIADVVTVRDRLIERGCKRVSILSSAPLIDREVAQLRQSLIPSLASLAERQVDGMALREFLALPGLPMSAWWLGLIAERNPLKTSAFMRFAQVGAVISLLAGRNYQRCWISVDDTPTAAALSAACLDAAVACRRFKARSGEPLGVRLRRRLREGGAMAHRLSGFVAWLRLCYRIYLAKRILGAPVPKTSESATLLFVSYFPSYDEAAARGGEFRNKYAQPLQDLLRDSGRQVQWLLMYADLNGASYRDALVAARNFAARGEQMVMLEQFARLSDCLRILALFLNLGRRASRSYCSVRDLPGRPLPPAVEPVWRNLWHESLGDREMVYGLYHAVVFHRAVAAMAGNASDCLYYCEMQAWEKALCRACADATPPLRTIGFLHASIPANYWPYAVQPTEAARHGRTADLPVPDILAVGGEYATRLMAPTGIPHVVEVEAVRYLYLTRRWSSKTNKSAVPTLLVAGSIDRVEAAALLHLLLAMGPPPGGMRILLKGHPAMPFAPLLADLTGGALPAGFVSCDGDLQGALEQSWAALVSASTVALEALAYGCRVIAPVFPDAMQMNPLADFPGSCEIVATPEELFAALVTVAAGAPPGEGEIAAGNSFVGRYWNLDTGLPTWKNLLAPSTSTH